METNYFTLLTKNKTTFNFSVVAGKELGLSKKALASCISRISKQTDLTQNQVRQLKITKEGDQFYYAINEANPVRLIEQAQAEDLVVRVMNASERTLPRKTFSVKENYLRLVKDHAVSAPVVHQLWALVAAPIALILRIFQHKGVDLSLIKQQTKPATENLLPSTLEWMQDLFKEEMAEDPLKAEGEAYTFKQQIAEALALGKSMNTLDPEKKAAEITETLLARFQEKKGQGKPLNLMLLPLGYRDAKTFHPLMLAFSVNAQGELRLSRFEQGNYTHETQMELVWDKAPEKEKLQETLKVLLMLTQAPLNKKHKKGAMNLLREGAKLKIVEEAFRVMPGAAPIEGDVPFDFDKQQIPTKLLLASGAKPLPYDETRRQQIGDDPWKILQETIRKQFPDMPIIDKMQFSYAVIRDRLQLVLDQYKHLSSRERAHWLQKLDHDVQSLRRMFYKEGGIDDETFLNPLKREIDALQERLKDLVVITKEEAEESFSVFKSAKAQNTKLAISSKKELNEQLRKAAANQPSALTPQDFQRMTGFQNALINAQKIPDLLPAHKALNDRIDELMNEGQIEDALYLSTILMRKMRALKTVDEMPDLYLSEENTGADSEQYSIELKRTAHFFSEAKIKTEGFPLSPSEMLGLQFLKSSVLRLILAEKIRIFSRLKNLMPQNQDYTIEEMKNAGLTYEEVMLLLSQRPYKGLINPGSGNRVGLRPNYYEEQYLFCEHCNAHKSLKSKAATNLENRNRTPDHLERTVDLDAQFLKVPAIQRAGDLTLWLNETKINRNKVWEKFHGTLPKMNVELGLTDVPVSEEMPLPPIFRQLLHIETHILHSQALAGLPLNKRSIYLNPVKNAGRLQLELESKIQKRKPFNMIWMTSGNKRLRRLRFEDEQPEDQLIMKGQFRRVWNNVGQLVHDLNDESLSDPLNAFRSRALHLDQDPHFTSNTAISYILQTPHLIDKRSIQSLLYTGVFSSTFNQIDKEVAKPWMADAMPKLKAEIEKAIDQKHPQRALFLIQYCEDLKQFPYEGLPGFDAVLNVNGEAVNAREWVKELLTKKNLPLDLIAEANAVYIKMHAADEAYFDLRQNPAVLTPKTVAELFACSAKIDAFGEAANLALFPLQAKEWLSSVLIPCLISDPRFEQKRDEYLNAIAKAVFPDRNHRREWQLQVDKGNLCFSNQEVLIDLFHLKCIDMKNPVREWKGALPHSIVSSRSFKAAFSKAPKEALIERDELTEGIVYRFTTDAQEECCIRQRRAFIQYEKKIDGEWYRFELPHEPQTSQFSQLIEGMKMLSGKQETTTDQLLERMGFWIHLKNPRKGLLNLGQDVTCSVAFSAKGRIRRIYNEKNWNMIQSGSSDLHKPLCPSSPEDVLFFHKGSSGDVREIRILSANLTLTQKKKNNWVVTNESPYKGMVFRKGGHGTGFAKLLARLPGSFEDTGLVLHDDKSGVSQMLLYLKPHNEGQPPLTIQMDAQGRIQGEPAACIYLSQIAAKNGLYDQARFYLEKAENLRVIKETEYEQLNQVFDSLETLPAVTMREIAYKCKALTQVMMVRRKQGQKIAFQADDLETYAKQIQAIGSLWNLYQTRSQHAFHGKGMPSEQLAEQELLLTTDELVEIHRLQQESLQRPPLPPAAPDPILGTFRKSGIDKTTLALLLSHMKKPSSHAEKLFQSREVLDSTALVDRFFELWNAIIDKDLKPEKLLALFVTTSAPGSNLESILEVNPVELLASSIRPLLLTLAKLPAEEKAKLKLPLDKLYKYHRSIPTSLVGLVIGNILAGRGKEKPLVKEIREFLEPILDVFKTLDEIVSLPEPVTKRQFLDRNAPLQALGGQFRQQQGINPERAAEVRHIEMGQRIHKLEADLKKAAVALPAQPALNIPLGNDPKDLSAYWEDQELFEVKPQQSAVELKRSLCFDAEEAIETLENRALKNGLDGSAQELTESLKYFRLTTKNFKKLKNELKTQKRAAEKEADSAKEQIFKAFAALDRTKLPATLRAMHAHPERFHEGTLFEELIHRYQRSSLNEPALESLITQFLIARTMADQLGDSSKQLLIELDSLMGTQPKEKSPDRKAWDLEWTLACTELRKIYKAGTNRTRYLKNGVLDNPRFSRKYLVAEFRSKRILREDQRALIEKMEANPSEFYELRMGAGKTSMILPIVMNLLAEKGDLPVALLKEELLTQNLADLDYFTRDLFEQAAFVFRFEVNTPIEPASLAEQYFRLLEAKKGGGYIVSSVHAKAALEQMLGVVYASFAQEPSLLLEQQIEWLSKIRSLLNGNEGALGFKTRTIGDEIDDIFDGRKEDNLATGAPAPLSIELAEAMEQLLQALFTSNNRSVKKLRDALNAGNQAALLPKEIKEILLPALAEAIRPEWKDYLTVPAVKPPLGKLDPRNPEQKKLAALKHLFQITLPVALQLQPGIDVGIKESNGYTVGPQQKGLEKSGFIFGDEFDVMANHYLQYALKLPQNEFSKDALADLEAMHPELYEEISEKAARRNLQILEYLNLPENYPERIRFFKMQVVEKGLIRRFAKQFTVPVQEVVSGTDLGGVTGTLNRYLMPLGKGQTTTDLLQPSTCRVEGETLLRIAAHQPPEVKTAADADMIQQFVQASKDLQCKAIINEGASLEGKDALEVVKALAQAEPDANKRRIIVFVHPHCDNPLLSRKICLMNPDNSIRPIEKPDLNRQLKKPDFKKKVLFYFGPPDTRGTDFVIPPGYGLVVTGPTTSRESFQQAVWRLRGLGDKHSVRFLLPDSVKDRILEGKEPGDQRILWTDVYNDIKKRNCQELLSLNHQALTQQMSLIVTRGLKNLVYSPLSHEMPPLVHAVIFQAIIQLVAPEKFTDLLRDYQPSEMIDLQAKMQRLFDGHYRTLSELKNRLVDEMPKFPRLDNAFQRAFESIDEMINQLQEEEERFGKSIEQHQQRQPLQISSAASGQESVIVQVQEQEQVQQQQLQVQQQAQATKKRVGAVPIEPGGGYLHWSDQLQRGMLNSFNGAAVSLNNVTNADCGFDESIIITDEMRRFLSAIDHKNGTPLGRFALLSDGIVLMAPVDPRHEYRPIYELLPGKLHEEGCLLTYQPSQAAIDEVLRRNHPRSLPDVPLKSLVQLKWFLGYSEFSDRELDEVKRWLTSISRDQFTQLRDYTRQKCSSLQLPLMDEIRG